MAEEAPSTAPGNPLEESLAKILGKKSPVPKTAGAAVPLSETTGTQSPLSYDPNQSFRPTGDTINLSNVGGAGVSTPEQWSHDIQLQNLKQSQLEFEYQKAYQAQQAATAAQQSALANALSQAQLGISKAGEARAAALGPAQLQAANLANQQARQAIDVQKQQQELAIYEKTGLLPSWLRGPEAYTNVSKVGMGPIGQATAQKYIGAGYSPYTAYTMAYGGQDPYKQMLGGTTLYKSNMANDELNRQIWAGNAIKAGIDPNQMEAAMMKAMGASPPGYATNYSGVGPQYAAKPW